MRIADAVFRVIDTETTGTVPGEDRICEVAYIDITARRAFIRAHSQYLNPGREIPPTASAIHHITAATVAGCPTWEEVKPGYVAGCYAAHNAQFDAAFTGLPGLWLCTQRLAMHLWPELPAHGNQVCRYALGLSPVPTYSSVNGGNHSAGFDVATTAALLCFALARAEVAWPHITTVEALIEHTNKPAKVHRIPFESAGRPLATEAEDGLLDWIIRKQAGGSDVIFTAHEEIKRRARARRPSLFPAHDADSEEEPDSDIPF